jgi:hypothetical protein
VGNNSINGTSTMPNSSSAFLVGQFRFVSNYVSCQVVLVPSKWDNLGL